MKWHIKFTHSILKINLDLEGKKKIVSEHDHKSKCDSDEKNSILPFSKIRPTLDGRIKMNKWENPLINFIRKATLNKSTVKAKILNIIHFNDVYNLEEQKAEPKGGAARFLTAVNHWREVLDGETIVLFSGDLYSPSSLSTV